MKSLIKMRTLVLMLVIGSALILGSCKKDTVVDGDHTALTALIAQADAIANAATTTNYPQAAITTFKATLATIKAQNATVITDATITNLVTQLTEAMKTFDAANYMSIDESLYLNAGWHFDEGSGTTATAYSTVKHVGTFKKGNTVILGTDALSPTWVAGVKGGYAVYLDKGAHLEVPYTTAFLPVSISIAVWIKPIELKEDNYIVSQNYWQGYKLQTQGGGKPFFTYKKATDQFINVDNETDNSVKINVWTHLVVTVNSTTKELKFFINGTLTKTWTEANGGIVPFIQTLVNPDPQPFIIGCVATDAELARAGSGFMDWTTAANFGFFRGAIDELKIYNIALADGQVMKLYNDEK